MAQSDITPYIRGGHVFVDSDPGVDAGDVFFEIQAWGAAANVDYDVLVNGETDLVSMASVAIAENAIIRGHITNLVVNSGEVLAYYLTNVPSE